MENNQIRNAVGEYMKNIGKKHKNVVVVNADLMGTCRNRSFVEKFPKRSFNVGIAEANMVSFAAGLAHEGFMPFIFTMAPFMSMRACEQVRDDIAYANLPVKMIAPYAGLSGGISGATHWAIEDCGIMCSIPNITVLEPCDCVEAVKMLEALAKIKGPVYMRLTVEPTPQIYKSNFKYKIGKANVLRNGNDGCIICSGVTVGFVLEAADKIKKEFNKNIRVIDMHTIKPIDKKIIEEVSAIKNIIVVQDHNIFGGLGSNVKDVIAESGSKSKVITLGINDKFNIMGHASNLYKINGYDASSIYKTILRYIIR